MPAGSTCSTVLQVTRAIDCKHSSPSQLKMQKCTSLLLVSVILCATISQTFGLVLTGKDKRGWTLNSAGYLLGPRRIDPLSLIKEMPIAMGREESPGEYAIDNHRSFNDKHGFGGKRELQPEEDVKSGNFFRTLSDDNVLRTLIEFLTYLHLKESGALDNLSSPMSSEETNQS
ncbi:galanin peptides isoform X1 [Pseudophryne corroboree]|uniref:galanin peptides isoform X1 n=1 Tax=Pseudophryne corroboree TaxID=495146 RepID=UPI00308161F6